MLKWNKIKAIKGGFHLLGILHPVMHVAVTGGIAVFVVLRMKHKYKHGTLIKKEKQKDQNFVDSLIPMGVGIGTAFAILISFFSAINLLTTVGWGAGIGMLLGYLVYEMYSKKAESYSS